MLRLQVQYGSLQQKKISPQTKWNLKNFQKLKIKEQNHFHLYWRPNQNPHLNYTQKKELKFLNPVLVQRYFQELCLSLGSNKSLYQLTLRLGSFRVSRANENVPYISESYGSHDSMNSKTNSRSSSSPLQSSLKVEEKVPKMDSMPAQVDTLFSNKVLFPIPSDVSWDSSESFHH